jgi:hypothetical protein
MARLEELSESEASFGVALRTTDVNCELRDADGDGVGQKAECLINLERFFTFEY